MSWRVMCRVVASDVSCRGEMCRVVAMMCRVVAIDVSCRGDDVSCRGE